MCIMLETMLLMYICIYFIKVPTVKESAFFTFLNPLGFDIWIFVFGAFFMAAFTLFTLARFSPYEWVNPTPWRETNYLTNNLDMSNSFWFITGTLLRQASGVNPQVKHHFHMVNPSLDLLKRIGLNF